MVKKKAFHSIVENNIISILLEDFKMLDFQIEFVV